MVDVILRRSWAGSLPIPIRLPAQIEHVDMPVGVEIWALCWRSQPFIAAPVNRLDTVVVVIQRHWFAVYIGRVAERRAAVHGRRCGFHPQVGAATKLRIGRDT